MNKQPIEQALDSDLRLSKAALLRAAQRARELAMSTGTAIVVCRNGVIEHIKPEAISAPQTLQQPAAPYELKE